MAWFVKSFSICILQGLNGKISQAFELSKGTFTQAIQSLYACWGDHLRLTASVPPAAFAAQNGRNPPPVSPSPLKLQILFLCITNIDRILPGVSCSLHFQAGNSMRQEGLCWEAQQGRQCPAHFHECIPRVSFPAQH